MKVENPDPFIMDMTVTKSMALKSTEATTEPDTEVGTEVKHGSRQ
jgi:hypothetical protein